MQTNETINPMESTERPCWLLTTQTGLSDAEHATSLWLATEPGCPNALQTRREVLAMIRQLRVVNSQIEGYYLTNCGIDQTEDATELADDLFAEL